MDLKTAYFRKLTEEQAFIASARGTVTSGGGTFNLHLKNPSDESKLFFIESINVETQGVGNITVYDSFDSLPSGGTTVNVDNMYLDTDNVSPDIGVGQAASDVSFTGSSDAEHSKHVIGSGQGQHRVGGTDIIGSIALDSGRELVVEIQNTSNSNYDASITIVYFQSSQS